MISLEVNTVAIPKDKLESWARPGKNEMSKDTYAKMRTIIENNVVNVDVFLQGSYANSTNVRDNSDIDIVVVFKDYTYRSYWNTDVKNARDTLYNSINGKNNFQFTKGHKTVKYGGNQTYVPADLVPCVQYSTNGHDGVIVYDHRTRRNIISYPKQHKTNGESKSGDTNGNYKKAVRMFKNARNYAVNKRIITESTCPSYFLECLLYNINNDMFSGNESDIFYNVLKVLYDNRHSLSNLKRQDEIQSLFDGTASSWDVNDARLFIEEIAHIWDNWGKIYAVCTH